MLSKTHKLTETITEALGPIFRSNPDYSTIFQAMCLVMARTIQATPDKGKEYVLLEEATNLIDHALEQFIKLEEQAEAQQEARNKVVARGLDAFAEFAKPVNGELVEPGSAADYPDNCDQPVAKTVRTFTPHQGLIAINGGMGAEARDEAEEAQGQASGEGVIAEPQEPKDASEEGSAQ